MKKKVQKFFLKISKNETIQNIFFEIHYLFIQLIETGKHLLSFDFEKALILFFIQNHFPNK